MTPCIFYIMEPLSDAFLYRLYHKVAVWLVITPHLCYIMESLSDDSLCMLGYNMESLSDDFPDRFL